MAILTAILAIGVAALAYVAYRLRSELRETRAKLATANGEIKETKKLRKTALAALGILRPKLASAEAARAGAQRAMEEANARIMESRRREMIMRGLAERLLQKEPESEMHRARIRAAMRAELGPPPDEDLLATGDTSHKAMA